MLELRNVSKSYGENEVLKSINFVANKGDFITITGKSGSGKSTLLNIISGIERPSKGDVIINGFKNPKPNSSKMQRIIRDHINYMFQNFALIENDTVMGNLMLALTYSKKTKQEKVKDINRVLNAVKLGGVEDHKIYTLSGGEQQRVAMARVLLSPKDILLADEPTGSLDDENKYRVIQFLNEVSQSGVIVVVVTHDRVVAESSHMCYSLSNGVLTKIV